MYKNSLKILVFSVALILSFSSTVNALTKAEKIDECLYGSLSDEEINSLITEIDEWKSIYKRSLRMNTALCFTKLTGAPADFINGEGLVVDEAGTKQIEESRRKVEALEAAKLELKELKSQLTATITNLEKRAACVSAKSFQTNAKLEAISKRFEQSNNTLILDDTHEACTELYSSNKSAAMLNQTCVEAFQRMGHPNLVFSEAEPRAEFTAELSGLVTLKTSLEEELMEARVKLLEAEGVVTEEGFNQQVADDLEAKSCAEFGYEGVYLD